MDVDKIGDSGSDLTPPRSRKSTPPPPGFIEAEGRVTPEEQDVKTAIFLAKLMEADASVEESTTCVSSIGEEDPPPLFPLYSMLTPTSTPTTTPTSILKSNCTFAFSTTPFDKDRLCPIASAKTPGTTPTSVMPGATPTPTSKSVASNEYSPFRQALKKVVDEKSSTSFSKSKPVARKKSKRAKLIPQRQLTSSELERLNQHKVNIDAINSKTIEGTTPTSDAVKGPDQEEAALSVSKTPSVAATPTSKPAAFEATSVLEDVVLPLGEEKVGVSALSVPPSTLGSVDRKLSRFRGDGEKLSDVLLPRLGDPSATCGLPTASKTPLAAST